MTRTRSIIIFIFTLLFYDLSSAAGADPNPFSGPIFNRRPEVIRVISRTLEDSIVIERIRLAVTAPRQTPFQFELTLYRPNDAVRHPAILLLSPIQRNDIQQDARRLVRDGYVVATPSLKYLTQVNVPSTTGSISDEGFAASVFRFDSEGRNSLLWRWTMESLKTAQWLTTRFEVIPSRIAVVGSGWAAVAAMRAGELAGGEFRAMVLIDGGGHFEIGSAWMNALKKLPKTESLFWRKWLDPGGQSGKIHAATLMIDEVNNRLLYPNAVTETYRQIGGYKRLIFINDDLPANINPNFDLAAVVRKWLDYWLMAKGSPFPDVTCSSRTRKSEMTILVNPQWKEPPAHLLLYTTHSASTGPSQEWQVYPIQNEKGRYQITRLVRDDFEWYVQIIYPDGLMISTPINEPRSKH